jgi:hypothetical protein
MYALRHLNSCCKNTCIILTVQYQGIRCSYSTPESYIQNEFSMLSKFRVIQSCRATGTQRVARGMSVFRRLLSETRHTSPPHSSFLLENIHSYFVLQQVIFLYSLLYLFTVYLRIYLLFTSSFKCLFFQCTQIGSIVSFCLYVREFALKNRWEKFYCI